MADNNKGRAREVDAPAADGDHGEREGERGKMKKKELGEMRDDAYPPFFSTIWDEFVAFNQIPILRQELITRNRLPKLLYPARSRETERVTWLLEQQQRATSSSWSSMRAHDHVLSSRPWSPVADILFYGARSVGFAPYGDEWRRSRKVVAARMLSARKVESFRRGPLEEVRVVLAKIREAAAASADDGTGTGTAVDVSELVSAYANDVVLGESHRAGGCNRMLMELVNMNVALLGGFNLEDYFPRLTRMELLRSQEAHLCTGREGPQEAQQDQSSSDTTTTEDLIHVLLAAEEEYGLTRGNVKALLMETFQARSIESSYLVLDYAMAELMLNRHVMARLQTEIRTTTPLLASAGKKQDMVVMEEHLSKMPYLKAVVKETLRLHPPGPLLIPRLSTTDCDVNVCWIPAGTRIFVNAWALGRDPASWDRAEEFMPERFLEQEGSGSEAAATPDMKGTDFAFLPFGAGRRICPGINFGIATTEIMLANLMYHFDWKLQNEGTGGGVVDMSEVFGMALRRKEKLFLVPTIPASSG
ncbi:unnamed protein product [Miscanthus lutarioriparius]|uniref:Cytochrome P450 n=1 Tax=Miscanthus lutarioriparius TaxID=422564 RepID=A0A811PSV0_9POAL|nr:unnamed protein product [Miscanthus lutarioriparius]